MREQKLPKNGRSPGLIGLLERLSVKTARIRLADWMKEPEETPCKINRTRFGSREEMKRSWWH